MTIVLDDIEVAFDSGDACRIAQISNRQLNHWDQLGIASPSVDPGKGSGHRRAYRLEDVIMLRLASELRQFGAPLDVIAEAIEKVRQSRAIEAAGPKPNLATIPNSIILAIGGDGFIVVGERLDNHLLTESASMIVVRLNRIANQVMRQVNQERQTAQLRRLARNAATSTPSFTSPRIESPNTEPLDVERPGEVGQFETMATSFAHTQRRAESTYVNPVVAPDRSRRDVDQTADNQTTETAPRRARTRSRSAPKPQRSSGASAWGDAW